MKNEKINPASVRYLAVMALASAWVPLMYCAARGILGPDNVRDALMGTLAGQAVFLLADACCMGLLVMAARRALVVVQIAARKTSTIRMLGLPSWVFGKTSAVLEETKTTADKMEKVTTFALGGMIYFFALVTTATGVFLINHDVFVVGSMMVVVSTHAAILSKTTGIAGMVNIMLGRGTHLFLKALGRFIAGIVLAILLPAKR